MSPPGTHKRTRFAQKIQRGIMWLMAHRVQRRLAKPMRDLTHATRDISVTQASAQQELPAMPPPRQAGRFNAHVLLAEDNTANQDVTMAMLELLGCRVTLATNGREAVKAAASLDYDIILMNCHMPELDGFGASREIRTVETRQGKGRRVPIIALTADVQVGIREACASAGMDDYLGKPYTEQKLAEVLENWVGGKSVEATDIPMPEVSTAGAFLDPNVFRQLKQVDEKTGRDVSGKLFNGDLKDAPLILVIDDDEVCRVTMEAALTEAGFRVALAETGTAGLSAMRRIMPDLVIVNAYMDGISGFDVNKRIRSMDNYKNMPIMMVTGLNDQESINRAFLSGADDFTTKPVNYAILLHRIHFMLRASRQARALREQQLQLATAQRMARLGSWQWNMRSGQFDVSPELAGICGLSGQDRPGSMHDYLSLVHPNDRPLVRGHIENAAAGSVDGVTVDYRIRGESGEYLRVQQAMESLQSPLTDNLIVGTVQDVTKQRANEDSIRKMVYYDGLTGVASRTHLMQHLAELIRSANRTRHPFYVLFIDLDGFKDINDTLGHETGDDLLATIGQRLQSAVREVDFVARLGGDEFCVLMAGDQGPDATDVNEVAERVLESIGQPVEIDNYVLRPQASIGIARHPDDGKTPSEILKAADSAMYEAKRHGKQQIAFYREEITHRIARRLAVEQALRTGVAEQQFVLHYQPQIDLVTGRMAGVEALLRWEHPDKGVISPAEFIPVLERIRMIDVVENWVLQQACKQIMSWREQGIYPLTLAVNVSPLQFESESLVGRVEEALASTGIPPQLLELGITESTLQSGDTVIETLRRLKRLDVNIAIDDFGTGYSSLGSLKDLPIDTLKIDRLFIKDVLDFAEDSVLLGTIVGLAHAMDHSVVAEGVERLEQINVIKGLGCDFVQGYYFSEPVPADELVTLIRQFGLNREQQPPSQNLASSA